MRGTTGFSWKLLSGLLVLGLAGWGIVAVIGKATSFIAGLQSDVAIACITGGVALVSATITIAIGKLLETRSAIRSELRAKKTPVYEQIVSTLFGAVFASKLQRQQPSQDELIAFFAQTTEKLTIWGSDDVLRAFSRFRSQDTSDPGTMIFRFEALLFAIRRDLGHGNVGMGRGSILRLFINDIDDHLHKPR